MRLVREPLQIKSSSCFVFWIQQVGLLLYLLCDFFSVPEQPAGRIREEGTDGKESLVDRGLHHHGHDL